MEIKCWPHLWQTFNASSFLSCITASKCQLKKAQEDQICVQPWPLGRGGGTLTPVGKLEGGGGRRLPDCLEASVLPPTPSAQPLAHQFPVAWESRAELPRPSLAQLVAFLCLRPALPQAGGEEIGGWCDTSLGEQMTTSSTAHGCLGCQRVTLPVLSLPEQLPLVFAGKG